MERLQRLVNRFRFSSLEKTEERIRNKSIGETAVAFDARGKYLFSRDSPTPRIVFSQEEAGQMKGAIVTHNHPAGTPFGDTDIQTACEAQVREMRVVTAHYTFSMKPPTGGWNGAFWSQVVAPARVEAEMIAVRELQGRMEEFTDEKAYQFAVLDRTWQEAAKRVNISYVKTRYVNRPHRIRRKR